jgi:hypothetical protein
MRPTDAQRPRTTSRPRRLGPKQASRVQSPRVQHQGRSAESTSNPDRRQDKNLQAGASLVTTQPKPPTGLRPPGRKLWTAVAARYVLTAAETEMLGQACRTADELDRLEKAVRALPELTTTGSTGQIKPHPLLAEVRAHPCCWNGSQRPCVFPTRIRRLDCVQARNTARGPSRLVGRTMCLTRSLPS